jgi:protein-histidine pros-kinase
MTLSPAELAHRALYAAPDAMVLIDASGVIRFANKQVIAVFGYGLETVIGTSMAELVPQFCRGGYIARGEKRLSELGVRAVGAQVNLRGRRMDGTEFPVEMSVSPIGDADGHQVAIIRNVTERKRAELAIVAAGEDTERATPGKSRFLATVSHDLRQPVQTLALLNGIFAGQCPNRMLSKRSTNRSKRSARCRNS